MSCVEGTEHGPGCRDRLRNELDPPTGGRCHRPRGRHRVAARRTPRDARRPPWPGCRRDRQDRAGSLGQNQNRIVRLPGHRGPQRCRARADGGHVRHPGRRQPRRVLRDDSGDSRVPSRNDQRRRRSPPVVRGRRQRTGPRRRPVPGGRHRRRLDGAGPWHVGRPQGGRAGGQIGGHRLRTPDRTLPATQRPADPGQDRRGNRTGTAGPGRRVRRGARRAGKNVHRCGRHGDHTVRAEPEPARIRTRNDCTCPECP